MTTHARTDSAASKYDVDIDLDQMTSHTRVLRLVSPGSRVLDLGCATGALAQLLRARGCHVVGVENDAEAAAIARDRCDEVLELDLQTDALQALDEHGPFDVIVAADVLEHLAQPERLLRLLPPLLTTDGYLVTSIPNVAHGSVRLALLAGEFPYRDTGLLDSTHLRFYTRSSMTSMLAEGGFAVAYVEDQTHPAEAGEVLGDVDLSSLPEQARAAVREDPDSSVYQFIAVSTPREPSGLIEALARQEAEHKAAAERARATHEALALQLATEQQAASATAEALQATIMGLQAALEEALRTSEGLRHEVLAGSRAQVLAAVQSERDAKRITTLETQLAELNRKVPDWIALEQRHHLVHWELEQIHASRLWRLGTAYRRILGDRLHRR